MRTRLLLGALGVAGAAYGAWLLLAEDLADIVDTAIWLAAGVVLHDFVLVPATFGVGWLLARLVPAHRRTPLVVGLVVLGTLTVMAVPVLGGWGAHTDNATILDRGYTAGWLVVAGVIGVVVVVAMLRRSRGPGARRR